MSGPKILLLDVETAPNLVYSFQMFKTFIGVDQVVERGGMMSWAAKWLGDDVVMYDEDRGNNEINLIKGLVALVDEADMIIHQNGVRFDMPVINSRAIALGLKPPRPYRNIDTFQVAKRHFKFPHNSLKGLAEVLGCSPKLEHEKFAGFSLWRECLAGNDEAWSEMKKYNIQDVLTLEEIYYKLRPWMPTHPNVAIYHEDGVLRCPTCGAIHLQKRGTVVRHRHTNAQKYQQYSCQNCGKWFSRRYTEFSKRDLKNVSVGS